MLLKYGNEEYLKKYDGGTHHQPPLGLCWFHPWAVEIFVFVVVRVTDEDKWV